MVSASSQIHRPFKHVSWTLFWHHHFCRSLFLETLWEQFASQLAGMPKLPSAGWGMGWPSPKCSYCLPGPHSLLLPSSGGQTKGAAAPLLQYKVKGVDTRLDPKSNKRYKKESWLAPLVNSYLRAQLCHSCRAAPTLWKLSCQVSNKNTWRFHVGYVTCSALGWNEKGREGHCSPLNRPILLTWTWERFWKGNSYQEDI